MAGSAVVVEENNEKLWQGGVRTHESQLWKTHDVVFPAFRCLYVFLIIGSIWID